MRKFCIALIAAIALASCDNSLDCTLIGCGAGLVVETGTPPMGPWTIEATPAGQPTRIFTCPAGSNCAGFITFDESMATPITFRVTVGSQSRIETLSPVIKSTFPNGKQCGPACRSQRVTLSIP